MKFAKLALYLDKLETTSSRIEITKILAELFEKSDGKDIDKLVYLLLGGLAPQYKGVVFNVAEAMMLKVLSDAYKTDLDETKRLYKQKGDLGDVAHELAIKSKAKHKNLNVNEVYEKLMDVAQDEGGGTVERKVKGLSKLLVDLDPLSARFVARIPVGRLRLGFSDKTIIDGLSWMLKGDKSLSGDIEKAYFVLPDVGLIAKKIKTSGVKSLSSIKPVIGVPIKPMLTQRIKSPTEMVEKMGKVAIEPKLDGLRISIHYKKGNGFVKTYTRNLNETSWMFPELNELGKYIKANDVILDSEAVGLSEDRKKMANFQTTMTRRRKHEIGTNATKTPIKFYIFDILYKNGKSLIKEDYLKRRKELESTVKGGNFIEVVESKITDDPELISKLHKENISKGLEGIIIKRVDSKYVPGRTGWRWVKMKEEEKARSKLADTIDCVVMGYSTGRGKRASFGVGQFLVGVRDEDKIKTVTKIGTGITDKQFGELKRRLDKIETIKKPKEFVVHKNLEPNYWVRPSLVVEIAADEITKSPKHAAGYALRFPRLIRFRDDKGSNQATTKTELIKLFKLQ